MNSDLLDNIKLLNPWLAQKGSLPLPIENYIHRTQEKLLTQADWDKLALILTGPRQAGKSTLSQYIARAILKSNRFSEFLYLNCDFFRIRQWLDEMTFLQQAEKNFKLTKAIIFIDEIQRLPNPGIFLKTLIDLKLPHKIMASGSSQLEIKSHVQEYLTGRHFEALILPLSYAEIGGDVDLPTRLIYGCYPQIVQENQKLLLIQQLFQDYLTKDIIEVLKIGKPDVMRTLISLIAHSSGQLVNYQQLAIDCKVSIPTVQHYLDILEKTYVLYRITPFVGNKRQELTSNPILYFIDNGFRNASLNNFQPLEQRSDLGLLVQGTVLQELLKWKTQHFYQCNIHYWRTKSGAEVDFIIAKNILDCIPIEVKYRSMMQPTISRSFRSFITAYQPKQAIMITKDFETTIIFENCNIQLIPLKKLENLLTILTNYMLS